jgi:hypothetical protein
MVHRHAEPPGVVEQRGQPGPHLDVHAEVHAELTEDPVRLHEVALHVHDDQRRVFWVHELGQLREPGSAIDGGHQHSSRPRPASPRRMYRPRPGLFN